MPIPLLKLCKPPFYLAVTMSLGHRLSGWMALDASDEAQLLEATARGRCIFTFNIRDFQVLAQRYPEHGGIILAAQNSWTLSSLIASLDRLLSETQAADWKGQVRWLNQWRT